MTEHDAMSDTLYREIRHKMDSGEDRFSVVIPRDGDGVLMDVNHMVTDGMSWTYDNSQAQDAPNGRRLSFIRTHLASDEDD